MQIVRDLEDRMKKARKFGGTTVTVSVNELELIVTQLRATAPITVELTPEEQSELALKIGRYP